jgi:hypothetical protein
VHLTKEPRYFTGIDEIREEHSDLSERAPDQHAVRERAAKSIAIARTWSRDGCDDPNRPGSSGARTPSASSPARCGGSPPNPSASPPNSASTTSPPTRWSGPAASSAAGHPPGSASSAARGGGRWRMRDGPGNRTWRSTDGQGLRGAERVPGDGARGHRARAHRRTHPNMVSTEQLTGSRLRLRLRRPDRADPARRHPRPVRRHRHDGCGGEGPRPPSAPRRPVPRLLPPRPVAGQRPRPARQGRAGEAAGEAEGEGHEAARAASPSSHPCSTTSPPREPIHVRDYPRHMGPGYDPASVTARGRASTPAGPPGSTRPDESPPLPGGVSAPRVGGGAGCARDSQGGEGGCFAHPTWRGVRSGRSPSLTEPDVIDATRSATIRASPRGGGNGRDRAAWRRPHRSWRTASYNRPVNFRGRDTAVRRRGGGTTRAPDDRQRQATPTAGAAAWGNRGNPRPLAAVRSGRHK